MKHPVILILFMLGPVELLAQNKLVPENFEQIIEEIFQNQDQDLNYEELYEVLLLKLTTPIDLNASESEELESIYILSNAQIQSLQSYKEKYGPLVSIFELQSIPLFDMSTIRRMLPFTTVNTNIGKNTLTGLPKRVITNANNYLIIRYERTLETKEGYLSSNSDSSSSYNGSPDKYYLRFRTNKSKDFSVGLTLEKDAGETLAFHKRKNGFDFISYHIQIKEKGRLKNFILGDFQMQYGQGLVFGAGFNIGKGAESILTTRKVNLGAIPYTSVAESGYFRGLVSTIKPLKKLSITAFTSSNRQSAAIIRGEQGSYVRTIRTSGLHRTNSEFTARKSIRENSIGGNVDYRTKNLNVGLNMLRTSFSLPVFPDETIANQSRFTGARNTIFSAYSDYRKFNQVIFGEIARSSSGGFGGVLGVIANLSSDVEVALVYRKYEKSLHSFYNSRFGESSNNTGEEGIYLGLKYQISTPLKLVTFFDIFQFAKPRFRISRPSTGFEILTRLSYRPNKQVNLYAQLRQQSKADNLSAANQDPNAKIKNAAEALKTIYLFNFDYSLTPNVSIKSRFQGSVQNFNGEISDGFAVVQDINFNHKRWRISTRLGLFQTDDFDNRQYIYERDVLYAFSIPALSGRGSRGYLLVRYKMNRKLDFWIKYGRTFFVDRKTVGSGLEEINDNKRTTLRIQSRLRL